MDLSCFNGLYDVLYDKCLKYGTSIDKHISANLQNAGIHTRPTKSNGLWCFVLLPTVLVFYTTLYDVPDGYRLAAYVSIGLSFYSLMFIMYMSMTCLVLTDKLFSGCLPSSIVACLLMYLHFKQDAMFSAVFSLPTTFMYSELLRRLLGYPKTFTIGEAMIVAQFLVVSMVVLVAKCFCNMYEPDAETEFIDIVIATVLSTVGLLVAALYYMKPEHRNFATLWCLLGFAAVLELMELHLLLGWTCLPRLMMFTFWDPRRRSLISFWSFLVLVCVVVLTARTHAAVKATTTTRKLFHVMAAAVFASGVLVDINLVKMAAGVGFGLIVFVEALRKSNIDPVSSALQSAFQIYSDEKDCGIFAMTPLYLYVGLASPLWLAPRDACVLEQLAGVLATGVGDTAASWFGSRYGQLKWPGGSRTLEGTAFNILSQIAVIYGFIIFDLIHCKNAIIRTAIAATASSLVEAKTDQVDNLILPFVTIIAFQATYFLA